MSANNRIHVGLQSVFVCLYITPSHYHHCANLSEDIEHACQIYFVECVSKIKQIFSVIHYTIYMGLCVFSLPINLVMIRRIYTLSYHHHQIGIMNYYPLFRVRSWNNGMCSMSLYILILMKLRFLTLQSLHVCWITHFCRLYLMLYHMKIVTSVVSVGFGKYHKVHEN